MKKEKDSLTPLFRQYNSIKSQYPDVILMFRLGDFYEMFGKDAEIASRELDIVLTSREAGKGKRIPMCGVPYHAVERYIARLLSRGYKVAICEQMEEPSKAKGLVRRAVTRIVTPGTVVEETMLEARRSSFLSAIARGGEEFGLAIADVSTGELLATLLNGKNLLWEELKRVSPAELLLLPKDEELAGEVPTQTTVTFLDEDPFILQSPRQILIEHFQVSSLRGFGIEEYPLLQQACAMILAYLRKTQLSSLKHITAIATYSPLQFMQVDSIARKTLEVTESFDGSRERSLLGVMDLTLTPMGSRLMRKWIEQPLLSKEEINNRLDAVEELLNQGRLRAWLREGLKSIGDLERIVGRCATGVASPKDLLILKRGLGSISALIPHLQNLESELLREIREKLNPLPDLYSLLDRALREDAPATLREGGIIKEGFSKELDELREAASQGKEWIAKMENQERLRTGIKSLKIGYNAVFGYYIEVTKPNLHLVPKDYIRKQTLVNAERFITEQLKELESKVLGAEERMVELEYELFVSLREEVMRSAEEILQVARAVAELDVLQSLAEVAARYNYTRPIIDEGDEIIIKDGRHPVVERFMEEGRFVPNDVELDCRDKRLLIITGPNMAGKSTYLRQVALIVLMAQVGSFVPAKYARIGIVDRIFTRIGARDELSSGQSTFMVEMNEVANILNNATNRSLIVLDEVGRGTSTFDGLSIAWAVAEYILDNIGARTLFATHYHKLNQLAKEYSGVRNLRADVKEEEGNIVFLYKIRPGATDKSYGIQVASLAGVPKEVLKRAREILEELEKKERPSAGKIPTRRQTLQLSLFEFEPHPVLEELKKLDLSNMTPLESLYKLKELQDKLSE
ncbi:DNA mismatch repair protein MutS [bacterium]|nr:DNA mismatch repair protein MutS [bacterium]